MSRGYAMSMLGTIVGICVALLAFFILNGRVDSETMSIQEFAAWTFLLFCAGWGASDISIIIVSILGKRYS